MASDISLTSAARSSLLSLQSTQDLLSRTQGRLTSGLKVSSAIDNAVSFFAAKGLDDRASDFTDRKDEIDQGISSLTAAVNGTSVTDGILKQLKGIVNSARTADSSTRATLTSQFADLTVQLNAALGDANYQGLNLVNGTSAKLTVYFSTGTAANLKVQAQNLKVSVILNTAHGYSAASAAVSSFNGLVTISGGSGLGTAGSIAGFSNLSNLNTVSGNGVTDVLNALSAKIDGAISTNRAAAARLGGNVTFLNTRLDFTKQYINTLKGGSGKLTLADLNEEGANLLALQTRQQIGVQSLGLAGQQQQAILSLLR
ncbi:MAG: hypothetical protein GC191_15485 [Azospirillum sp.]|nr:hypothetical protein [Azospirillum sp.]